MKKSIAIAGNIGSGKSTLLEFLASHFDIQPFYEPNESNPYLPSFYEDMSGWAFHSQLYFLANKFKLHQELDRTSGVVALDRTIFEDAEIFATALHRMGHIDKRDWATYQDLYGAILDAINAPDLLIYVRCGMRTLRKRIRLRGREMEQDIDPAYLRRLQRLYDKWIDSYTMSDVMVIDSDRLDYASDLVDQLDLIERIEAIV